MLITRVGSFSTGYSPAPGTLRACTVQSVCGTAHGLVGGDVELQARGLEGDLEAHGGIVPVTFDALPRFAT
jgi:hypothetical protein